jgi:hypothetical protein
VKLKRHRVTLMLSIEVEFSLLKELEKTVEKRIYFDLSNGIESHLNERIERRRCVGT